MVCDSNTLARRKAKAMARGQRFFLDCQNRAVTIGITPRQSGIRTAIKRGQFTAAEAAALGLSAGDIKAAVTGDTSLRAAELKARSDAASAIAAGRAATTVGTKEALRIGTVVAGLEAQRLVTAQETNIQRVNQQLIRRAAQARALASTGQSKPEVQNAAFVPALVVKGTLAERAIRAAGEKIGMGVFSLENLGRVAGALGLATVGGVAAGGIISAFRGRGGVGIGKRRSTKVVTKRARKQIKRLGRFRKEIMSIAKDLDLKVTRRTRTVSRKSAGVITAVEAINALRR